MASSKSFRSHTARVALVSLVIALAVVAAVSTFASDGSQATTQTDLFSEWSIVGLAVITLGMIVAYGIRYLRHRKESA